MLNSKELKEISKVINRKSIELLDTHVQIIGYMDNTDVDNLNPLLELKREYIDKKNERLFDNKVRYAERIDSESYKTKIDFKYIENMNDNLELALINLDRNVAIFERIFEGDLKSLSNAKFEGEMLLEVEFRVDGIKNLSKDIGEKLKDAGYLELLTPNLSYCITKRGNLITINFYENSIKFSIRKALINKQDTLNVLSDLKQCMISLYSQSIKKIKE